MKKTAARLFLLALIVFLLVIMITSFDILKAAQASSQKTAFGLGDLAESLPGLGEIKDILDLETNYLLIGELIPYRGSVWIMEIEKTSNSRWRLGSSQKFYQVLLRNESYENSIQSFDIRQDKATRVIIPSGGEQRPSLWQKQFSGGIGGLTLSYDSQQYVLLLPEGYKIAQGE